MTSTTSQPGMELLRAANDALYFLTIGEQFNEVRRCEKFKEAHARLAAALEAFERELNLPVRTKLPEQAKWDREKGMYLDDVERFSQ